MLTHHPNSSRSTDWTLQGSFGGRSLVSLSNRLSGLAAGIFFVSVPVFFQAPLVRLFPWVSLVATLLWLALGYCLMRYWKSPSWGDLIVGFTWSWLAGSLYWGWLREEPLLHLPIEAIGLPFALFALGRGSCLVGHCFYLGSLLGTAITDVYFYALDLIPFWRQVMHVSVSESLPILHQASEKVKTVEGAIWASILVAVLVTASYLALRSPRLHWWVFGGAVLGTLLVDALFGLSAFL